MARPGSWACGSPPCCFTQLVLGWEGRRWGSGGPFACALCLVLAEGLGTWNKMRGVEQICLLLQTCPALH